MPPWYVEKDIGIQHFKNDPSLSDEEIALIAKWADSRRAARQPGRPAAAARVERQHALVDRRARPGRAHRRHPGEGRRARLVGRDSADADGPHRGPLRRGPRSARGERRRLGRHRPRDRRRPLRVPPHDLEHAGHRRARRADQPERAVQPGGALRRRARHHHLAGARSGPRGRLLRPEVGAAAQGRGRRSCPTRSTCTRTAATPRRTSRSASSSCPRATSPSTAPRTSASATASTSTSRAWTPTSS